LVSIVPVFIICMFAYQKTFEETKERTRMFTTNVITLASKNITHMIESLENDSIDIAYNDVLQSTLRDYGKLSKHEIFRREKRLTDICTKKYIYNPIVTDIIALTNHYQPLLCFGDPYFRLSPSTESLKRVTSKLNRDGSMVIYYPFNQNFEKRYSPEIKYNRGNGFVLCRTIKSREDNQVLGILILRIDDLQIRKKFESINMGAGSEITIINSDAQIIFSTSNKYQPGDINNELFFIDIFNSKKQKGVRDVILNGKEHLGVYNRIDGTDWVLWGLIPYDYLNSHSRTIGLAIIGIGCACSFFAFLIARILLDSFINPLKKLDTAMEMVVNGDFDATYMHDLAPDELGELSRKFAWMTGELNARTKQIIEKENQKKEYEIKALQRQVNPHFMLNTLNTIAYLARIQGVDNIEKVTNALINLLIASSGKESSLIPVSKEISYIRDYINIQEFKFGYPLEVRYDIDEEIKDYLVPCFILQPIVENALVHGISDMEVGGIINIIGKKNDRQLHFIIMDNGAGISEEKIQKLLKPETEERKSHLSGIGIKNVNDRIQLLFGSEYGLTINSIKNEMTEVIIKLPILYSEEDNDESYTDCR